jgi:hypothetical protein
MRRCLGLQRLRRPRSLEWMIRLVAALTRCGNLQDAGGRARSRGTSLPLARISDRGAHAFGRAPSRKGRPKAASSTGDVLATVDQGGGQARAIMTYSVSHFLSERFPDLGAPQVPERPGDHQFSHRHGDDSRGVRTRAHPALLRAVGVCQPNTPSPVRRRNAAADLLRPQSRPASHQASRGERPVMALNQGRLLK